MELDDKKDISMCVHWYLCNNETAKTYKPTYGDYSGKELEIGNIHTCTPPAHKGKLRDMCDNIE